MVSGYVLIIKFGNPRLLLKWKISALCDHSNLSHVARTYDLWITRKASVRLDRQGFTILIIWKRNKFYNCFSCIYWGAGGSLRESARQPHVSINTNTTRYVTINYKVGPIDDDMSSFLFDILLLSPCLCMAAGTPGRNRWRRGCRGRLAAWCPRSSNQPGIITTDLRVAKFFFI